MPEHQSDAFFYCIIASKIQTEEFGWLAVGSIKWTDKEIGCLVTECFCRSKDKNIFFIHPDSWIQHDFSFVIQAVCFVNPSWLQSCYTGSLRCVSIMWNLGIAVFCFVKPSFETSVSRYSALWNHHVKPRYPGILHCETIMTSALVSRYSALWNHNDFSLSIPVFCIVNPSWLQPGIPVFCIVKKTHNFNLSSSVLYIVNAYWWNLL
jgi:hypothetical protein